MHFFIHSFIQVDEAAERATGKGPGVPPPSEAPFAAGYAAMLEIRTKELSWIGEGEEGEEEGGERKGKGGKKRGGGGGDRDVVPTLEQGRYPPKPELEPVPSPVHEPRYESICHCKSCDVVLRVTCD